MPNLNNSKRISLNKDRSNAWGLEKDKNPEIVISLTTSVKISKWSQDVFNLPYSLSEPALNT